jgi:hypothetical protein
VTQGVGKLSPVEINAALNAGVIVARSLLSKKLIRSAALRLNGETRIVGMRPEPTSLPRTYLVRSLMHA